MNLSAKMHFVITHSEVDKIINFIGNARQSFIGMGFNPESLQVLIPNRVFEVLKYKEKNIHRIVYDDTIRDYRIHGLKVAINYNFEIVVFNIKDDFPNNKLFRYIPKVESVENPYF